MPASWLVLTRESKRKSWLSSWWLARVLFVFFCGESKNFVYPHKVRRKLVQLRLLSFTFSHLESIKESKNQIILSLFSPTHPKNGMLLNNLEKALHIFQRHYFTQIACIGIQYALCEGWSTFSVAF